MNQQEIIARRLLVRGRVQGVWFRDSMRREAETLGLSGWVRNLEDGSVEAFIEGCQAAVDTLIAWSRQGPPLAEVSTLDVESAPLAGSRGFSIL